MTRTPARGAPYYSASLTAEDRKLLAKTSRGAQLGEEMAVTRLWLRRLLEGADLREGQATVKGSTMTRLLELLLRMASVQMRRGDERSVEEVADFNELVWERLVKAEMAEEEGKDVNQLLPRP